MDFRVHRIVKPLIKSLLNLAAAKCHELHKGSWNSEFTQKLAKVFKATIARTTFIAPDVREHLINASVIICTWADSERLWFPFIWNIFLEELRKEGLLKKIDLNEKAADEIKELIRKHGEKI